jgi:ATP-dependent RNA helicase DDX24/MAK5
LAYSLPILNHLLHTLASPEQEQPSPNGKRQLSALVLCPTRELALQVGKVIGSVVQTGIDSITAENDGVKVEVPSEDEEEEKMVPFSKKRKFPSKKPKKVQKPVKPVQQGKGPKAPPVISVATVVGGLSAVKQKRLLARGCDVLVATPGRLWDLIEEVSRSLSIRTGGSRS